MYSPDEKTAQAKSNQKAGAESAAPESTGVSNATASAAVGWSDEVGRRAPNILTLLRILAVPVFVFLLISPTPQSKLWATAIFVIASFTDWLDGYIARIYKAESILGTLLDPLADKILVMAALVMLVAETGLHRVPAWMVVVILAREFLVSGLRSLAAVKGTVVAASTLAKYKTACTMVAIFFLLVDEPYKVFGLLINFHQVGMFALWAAVLLSVYTGLDYAVKLRKMFV